MIKNFISAILATSLVVSSMAPMAVAQGDQRTEEEILADRVAALETRKLLLKAFVNLQAMNSKEFVTKSRVYSEGGWVEKSDTVGGAFLFYFLLNAASQAGLGSADPLHLGPSSLWMHKNRDAISAGTFVGGSAVSSVILTTLYVDALRRGVTPRDRDQLLASWNQANEQEIKELAFVFGWSEAHKRVFKEASTRAILASIAKQEKNTSEVKVKFEYDFFAILQENKLVTESQLESLGALNGALLAATSQVDKLARLTKLTSAEHHGERIKALQWLKEVCAEIKNSSTSSDDSKKIASQLVGEIDELLGLIGP